MLENGIYRGIEPEDYFAHDAVSKSMLWAFARNPWKWKHHPQEYESSAMRWGSMVDCLALTPERFNDTYAVQPSTYETPGEEKPWNRRAKFCRAWEEAHPGSRTPETYLAKPAEVKPWNKNAAQCKAWHEANPTSVSEAEYDELAKAAGMLYGNEVFREMAQDWDTQVAVVGKLAGAADCKCLIDIVPHKDGPYGNALVDLKTTGDLDSEESVARTISRFGYHVQAAFYLDLWNWVSGEDRKEFWFVFQSNRAPYEVVAAPMDQRVIDYGRRWYAEAMLSYANCLKADLWPTPFDGLEAWTLPEFMNMP
jgi:hypothetical protein